MYTIRLNGNQHIITESIKEIAYRLYFKYRSMGYSVAVFDPKGNLFIGRN